MEVIFVIIYVFYSKLYTPTKWNLSRVHLCPLKKVPIFFISTLFRKQYSRCLEIERAAKIVCQMELSYASDKGAFGLDIGDGTAGKEMIDAPMLKQAEQTLELARRAGLYSWNFSVNSDLLYSCHIHEHKRILMCLPYVHQNPTIVAPKIQNYSPLPLLLVDNSTRTRWRRLTLSYKTRVSESRWHELRNFFGLRRLLGQWRIYRTLVFNPRILDFFSIHFNIIPPWLRCLSSGSLVIMFWG